MHNRFHPGVVVSLAQFEVCESVSAVDIFFLHDGRNAWHSTWVQRYTSDAFWASFRDAAQRASAKRVQGSKFFIHHVPAVLFRARTAELLAVDINTDAPFSYLEGQGTRPKRNYSIAVGGDAVSLALGMTLHAIANHLNHLDKTDARNGPARGQVILEFGKRSEGEFKPLEQSKFLSYVSVPVAGFSSLGWSHQTSTIDGAGVLRLIAEISSTPPRSIYPREYALLFDCYRKMAEGKDAEGQCRKLLVSRAYSKIGSSERTVAKLLVKKFLATDNPSALPTLR
ncbi:hypothetical protein [Paraburkholderia agricolaris]|uniref:hypothetical protein n=1 Tax=Paraburkholderia agricolaris TaxID=2152888 RepID=UPI001291724C|nr:hypothetical protein [Paraburkholderia agricolaris]